MSDAGKAWKGPERVEGRGEREEGSGGRERRKKGREERRKRIGEGSKQKGEERRARRKSACQYLQGPASKHLTGCNFN